MLEDIKVLSPTAEQELAVENLMFVVAFDTQGNQTVFRASIVKASDVDFTQPGAGVSRIEAMSVVNMKPNSPTCCVFVSGGRQVSFCWG
jgi:hypothetical protein